MQIITCPGHLYFKLNNFFDKMIVGYLAGDRGEAPAAYHSLGDSVNKTRFHPLSPPKKLNFADFIEDQFCPIKCEEVFVRRHRGVHHKALVNLFIGNSTFGDTGTSIMIFCTGLRKCLFWTFILEAPA